MDIGQIVFSSQFAFGHGALGLLILGSLESVGTSAAVISPSHVLGRRISVPFLEPVSLPVHRIPEPVLEQRVSSTLKKSMI